MKKIINDDCNDQITDKIIDKIIDQIIDGNDNNEKSLMCFNKF